MKTVFRVMPGAYVVSFKKRGSGRLRNVFVDSCAGVVEASRKARAICVEEGWAGYREYGVSKYKRMLCAARSWGAEGTRIEWRIGGPEFWRPLLERHA